MVRTLDVSVGHTYPTKLSGDVVVIDIFNYYNILVEFANTKATKVVRLDHLRSGSIKDTTVPAIVYGVGLYDGDVSDSSTPAYRKWTGMLRRCYDAETQRKQPSYNGCTVSEAFKRFSSFKNWCELCKGYGLVGWELDKDIRIKGNKIYSEDSCCFVPKELNNLTFSSSLKYSDKLLGVSFHKRTNKYRATLKTEHLGLFDTPEEAFAVYKDAKEVEIKRLAEKWKDQINDEVYTALLNWKI